MVLMQPVWSEVANPTLCWNFERVQQRAWTRIFTALRSFVQSCKSQQRVEEPFGSDSQTSN